MVEKYKQKILFLFLWLVKFYLKMILANDMISKILENCGDQVKIAIGLSVDSVIYKS